jgi:hypothetical protein
MSLTELTALPHSSHPQPPQGLRISPLVDRRQRPIIMGSANLEAFCVTTIGRKHLSLHYRSRQPIVARDHE